MDGRYQQTKRVYGGGVPTQKPPSDLKQKVYVDIDNPPPGFDVVSRLVGTGAANLRYIISQTGAIVSLRGRGSGCVEPTSCSDASEPLHFLIEDTDTSILRVAKVLAKNLVDQIKSELIEFLTERQLQALPSGEHLQHGTNSLSNRLFLETNPQPHQRKEYSAAPNVISDRTTPVYGPVRSLVRVDIEPTRQVIPQPHQRIEYSAAPSVPAPPVYEVGRRPGFLDPELKRQLMSRTLDFLLQPTHLEGNNSLSRRPLQEAVPQLHQKIENSHSSNISSVHAPPVHEVIRSAGPVVHPDPKRQLGVSSGLGFLQQPSSWEGNNSLSRRPLQEAVPQPHQKIENNCSSNIGNVQAPLFYRPVIGSGAVHSGPTRQAVPQLHQKMDYNYSSNISRVHAPPVYGAKRSSVAVHPESQSQFVVSSVLDFLQEPASREDNRYEENNFNKSSSYSRDRHGTPGTSQYHSPDRGAKKKKYEEMFEEDNRHEESYYSKSSRYSKDGPGKAKPRQYHLPDRREEEYEYEEEYEAEFEEDDGYLPSELKALFRPMECQLCNVVVSSVETGKTHYDGKKHQKKVDAYINSNKWEREATLKSIYASNTATSALRDPDQLFCSDCNVTFASATLAHEHFKGKMHSRVVKGEIPPPGRFFCEICTIGLPSQKQLDVHLSGQKHRKALTMRGSGDAKDDKDNSDGPKRLGLPLNKKVFTCNVCNCFVTCQRTLDAHITSANHSKQRQRLISMNLPVPPEVGIKRYWEVQNIIKIDSTARVGRNGKIDVNSLPKGTFIEPEPVSFWKSKEKEELEKKYQSDIKKPSEDVKAEEEDDESEKSGPPNCRPQ